MYCWELMSLKNLNVLITVYNKESHIQDLVINCNQLLRHGAQIIIIDDGSSDNSYEILQTIKSAGNNLILRKTENLGSASARNLAVSLITRDYFIFLDADDLIDLENLFKAMAIVEQNSADLFKFPYYKNEVIKTIENDAIFTGLLQSRKSRNLLIQGLGYWRYIYASKNIRGQLRFLPTFEELGGKRFILDDFFWMLLIVSSNLRALTSTEYAFYKYVRKDNSSFEENRKNLAEYRSQFINFPIGLKLCLSHSTNLRIDRFWLLLYYCRYVNGLIGILDFENFQKFLTNTNKIKLDSFLCFFGFLYTILLITPLWLMRFVKLRLKDS